MDKLKSVISRGKDKTEPESTQGNTGKLTGPGSHFSSARQTSSAYAGNDTMGTTASSGLQGLGASDTTAAPLVAKYTAGPEAGGDSHIGTVSPEAVSITAQGGSEGSAIGTTSTYSTTHLTKGDPTSSVIDSESTDPITYKKPEVTSHARDTGVPEGAAQTAASKAFSSFHPDEGMPGGYPTTGYQNPYKASNLDPRVDNLPVRTKEETSASSAAHTLGTTAAGAGAAGLATAGAATAVSEYEKSRATTGQAPSALTSTTNPADRSAEYSQAEKTKMPEATAATAISSHDTTDEPQQPSMVSKVLGAVGLGSLVGAGAVAATQSNDSAIDTSEGPVTSTGTDSYRSGSMSGPPPSHHRKESIPTTAYPAGPGSARPIAPPVGGTRPPTEQTATNPENGSHLGRNTAIGAGVVGAVGAVGAGAVGAHEYEQSKALREATTEAPATAPSAAAATTTFPSSHAATTAVPVQQYSESKDLRESISTPVAATTEPVIPEEKEDHTKQNLAVAGVAGVGAVGAGAYAVKEHAGKDVALQQKEMEKQHAAQAKHAEKEQKAIEKEHAKEEKAAAKEEKKSEKAAEKDEKQREKQQAAAALVTERERKQVEDEQRKKREEELFAAGIGAGAVGAGAATYEAEKDKVSKSTSHDGEPLEKKPSLLKRLFKRKNKDTGEDEEYEAEEEETHKGVAATGVASTGAASAATYAVVHDEETGAPKLQPVEGSTTGHGGKSSEFIKPSYNPFTSKGEPEGLAGTGDINHESQGRTGVLITHEREETPLIGSNTTTTSAASTAGTTEAFEPEKHERNRLHKDPPADHPAAQREAITDLPYDASKDPAIGARLSEHHLGTGMGEETTTAKKLEHEEDGDEHKPGFREKLKGKLGLGHSEGDRNTIEKWGTS